MTQQFHLGQPVAVTVGHFTKTGKVTAPYATGAYVETGEGRIAYYQNSKLVPVKPAWLSVDAICDKLTGKGAEQ